MATDDDGSAQPGIGLISAGWMRSRWASARIAGSPGRC